MPNDPRMRAFIAFLFAFLTLAAFPVYDLLASVASYGSAGASRFYVYGERGRMVGTSPEQAKATYAVAVGGYSVDRNVLAGIRQASRATGVDFGYLMAQAAQESSFQPEAAAGTSSATGLYQFIERTWLDMVREHGAKHGLGHLARRIDSDANGAPVVSDAATRRQILDLRKDPRIAAALGAEFAKENREQLEARLQRPVGGAELYMAHFLGASGAGKFLEAIESDGDKPANRLLPEAAAANRNVFFDRDTGRAKSLREIYRNFQKSIDTKSQLFAGLADPAAAPKTAPASMPESRAYASAMARDDIAKIIPPGPAVNGTTLPGRFGLSTFSILALSALEILSPSATIDRPANDRQTKEKRAEAFRQLIG